MVPNILIGATASANDANQFLFFIEKSSTLLNPSVVFKACCVNIHYREVWLLLVWARPRHERLHQHCYISDIHQTQCSRRG